MNAYTFYQQEKERKLRELEERKAAQMREQERIQAIVVRKLNEFLDQLTQGFEGITFQIAYDSHPTIEVKVQQGDIYSDKASRVHDFVFSLNWYWHSNTSPIEQKRLTKLTFGYDGYTLDFPANRLTDQEWRREMVYNLVRVSLGEIYPSDDDLPF